MKLIVTWIIHATTYDDGAHYISKSYEIENEELEKDLIESEYNWKHKLKFITLLK